MITVTIIVFAYAMLGGAMGRFMWARLRRGMGCWPPPKCIGAFGHDMLDHKVPGAVLAGAFWPLMVPVFCGAIVTDRLTRREERRADKESRQRVAHERKLAELEAARQLKEAERQKTMADIQFLVENGIHAEVPGLYDGTDK